MSTKKKSINKPVRAKKVPSVKKAVASRKAAPAKKVSKKAEPAKKKPSAKVAPAKKSTAKVVPAKKPVAKVVPVKKPAAKVALAKKPVAKVVPVKKPVAKKVLPTKKPEPVKKAVSQRTNIEVSDSCSFAYSIAEMMKRENRRKEEEAAAAGNAIRLSRRPTSRSKGKDTLKFPAADLAEFKKRLLQLRQTATGQSATLKNIALEHTDDRGSEDDDGSDAFLRLQSLSQVDSKNKVIFKIDEALRRIADGTYGICEVCGQLIRKPRLMNMPFVHTCMECQSAMESPMGGR